MENNLIKKIVIVMILVMALFMYNKLFIACALGLISILFFISKVKLRTILERIFPLIPFFLMLAIFKFNNFIIVFMKASIAVLSIAIVTDGFSISSLIVFLNKVKTPQYFSDIFVIAFRFIFSFTDDIRNIKKGLALKGAFSKNSFFQTRYLGNVVGLFFVRNIIKSQNVYKSMKMKGS